MSDFADFHARFRAKLRLLREKRGLRQEDLEDHGVPLKTYQQIERGTAEPRLSTLYAIAEALDVEPIELLRVRGVDPEAAKVGRGGARPRGEPASKALRKSTKKVRRVGSSTKR